jgi:membrane protease YdiL (CAAX protease family)
LDKVFYWLPDWFLLTEDIKSFPKNALVVTFITTSLLTGLIAPIVEELYFRGFLLPRMSWMGKYAPFVNTVLFTVYHFWSPWQIITRILALLPMVYVVKWTKNIYIGILAHCMLNVLADAVPLLIFILSM